jgi:hypothetical protein
MKIFEVNSVQALAEIKEVVCEELAQKDIALIRGIFDQNSIRSSLDRFITKVNKSKILGTTKGSRELVRENTFKWSVGASSGAQIGNARLMVIGYNPIFAPDVYSFRSTFETLIQIRDLLRGDGVQTDDDSLKNGGFNACRFQLYPAGGGFMLGHRDYVAEEISLVQNAPLFQVLVFLTERGVDFEEGGAYLIKDDEKIDIESYARCGDIAIYNGNSFHGVADIDPGKPLSTTILTGRVVGLVTIYI